MLRLASPSFLNSNGSLRIMFLSQLLLLQKPTFVQEDLSGSPTPFTRRRRWWDLPNSRTRRGARTTIGSSTSLSITTTRDEDMEHKRSASFVSSSVAIIRSARLSSSPSIQKIHMPSTSTLVQDFDQRKRCSAANQSTGSP